MTKPNFPRTSVCRLCGCTEYRGCPEGCWWIDAAATVCSVCAIQRIRQFLLGDPDAGGVHDLATDSESVVIGASESVVIGASESVVIGASETVVIELAKAVRVLGLDPEASDRHDILVKTLKGAAMVRWPGRIIAVARPEPARKRFAIRD